jgi:murein DD-endopeptidase MepM/ murein hydrolase activator NlpD
MSFVMIATGAASRASVRTVSVRHLALAATTVSLALLATGMAIGYALSSGATEAPGNAVAQERPRAAFPFTLEQLGAISGRLFKLESQATQLGQRIGILQKEEAQAPAPRRKQPGSGGPMLPPREPIAGLEGAAVHDPADAPHDLQALEEQLARIERQIAAVSDAATQRSLDLMRLPSRPPVLGAELASRFGNRSDPFTGRHAFHAGLDFAAAHGTPILSAAGGTVTFAGYRSDYGNMVEIRHGNGLSTRYAHASKLFVRQGSVVAPGEKIALVGSTGRSTGPHLHFEVLRDGEQTDPKRYLAGL